MPGDAQDKTLIDIAVTGGLGALLAVFFAAIRAARAHIDEGFNFKRFAVGLASAGGVGAIVAWGLDALEVSRELSAVIIAMCGYCGGRLLDIVEAELPETIRAVFDALQKKIIDGKWLNNDTNSKD